ncbi:MAG TPA: carbohydrate porin, partial [Verrucomicrobiae bacterium]|nr:carbohydrate porin [Verrucomicrobiae bacterium]
LGRISAGDDFLVSLPDYLFMQNAFDGTPVGIFKNSPGMTAYPNATWGGLIDVKPTKRTYIMAGVYNGDPNIREIDHNGVDMSFNGPAFAIAEAGYRLNGLPGDSRFLGNYKIGSWYDNASFADYKTEGYGGPSQMKRGNWGLYAVFDQVVLPFGDPALNFGLMVFGAFLASPDQSVSQMPYYADGGVLCRGMFPSRPRDVAGFGIIYGDFSSDLRHAEEREEVLAPALGVQDYESVLEWTYKFYFRKGALFVQPDAQYVIRPGGTGKIDDAFVLGAQIGINL